MDLLLWRHAEAAAGEPDTERALTARGRRDARQIARWLAAHGPSRLEVFASPTQRTRQTAAALGCNVRILQSLAPGEGAGALLAATAWPGADEAWLLVGHQPMLGRLAALLLDGEEADWSFRKGALWWVRSRRRNGRWQAQLYTVQEPALMPERFP